MTRIFPTVGRTTHNSKPYSAASCESDSEESINTSSTTVSRVSMSSTITGITAIVTPTPSVSPAPLNGEDVFLKPAPRYMAGPIRRHRNLFCPTPFIRSTSSATDTLADLEATQAARLLLLLRHPHSERITPADFIASVNRHLTARGIDFQAEEFPRLLPLAFLPRRIVRHILRSVHDAWSAADPTPKACKKRCRCMNQILERIPNGETAENILRANMEDIVCWLKYQKSDIKRK
ncbi:hypothetical protein CspeluHIS016_0501820 [Cutaneotrichosporon spelunceum]|uniref:Uncharacterized protein n=1 Tax=Cutaneotrichosporon spelunceum TaxID=1672016 RepID=A0AAD3TX68_9TREE|nr:hypothetical protein CspeluHIS016_0501820 [Cutaneotrichosporon spelunceum]